MLQAFLKKILVGSPFEKPLRAILRRPKSVNFSASNKYWDERYRQGGNSGAGSYGRLAHFKAKILNDFVEKNNIKSIVEFGSGDGNQLTLASYPTYLGVDVSEVAVRCCNERFSQDSTKTFLTLEDYAGQMADLALSLDVVYHLVEDEIYDAYMTMLFDAAQHYVIIYASNEDHQPTTHHVRHRRFTDWVSTKRPSASLVKHIPNKFPFNPAKPNETSFADFYIFKMEK